MSKFVKFLILAIPVLGVGIYFGNSDHNRPIEFSAKGEVSSVEWNSRNHGMPLIRISVEAGEIKIFSSNRITLSPSQIGVGDSFQKDKGSYFCTVNGAKLKCVN